MTLSTSFFVSRLGHHSSARDASGRRRTDVRFHAKPKAMQELGSSWCLVPFITMSHKHQHVVLGQAMHSAGGGPDRKVLHRFPMCFLLCT